MKKLLVTLTLLVHFTTTPEQEIKQPLINRIPIVYHPEYDISFGIIHWIIEMVHPFDTKKYSHVFNYLTTTCGIDPMQCYQPEKITDEQLLQVHTADYLKSLNKSSTIARIVEDPLICVPNSLLQTIVINPMRFATGGTILGAKLAQQFGWAINLSGGYHHAKADQGGGFCVFGDIPLAIYELRKESPQLKVLIIDLDAHQGNGHEMMMANDPNTFILDQYSAHNYPRDSVAKKYITYDVPLACGTKDKEYLEKLDTTLTKALHEKNPEFIIYNAGTDIFEGDKLGKLSVSKRGIIARDELVFKYARQRSIPILMVLSGGYSKQSASIISESISNLKKSGLLETDCVGDTDHVLNVAKKIK